MVTHIGANLEVSFVEVLDVTEDLCPNLPDFVVLNLIENVCPNRLVLQWLSKLSLDRELVASGSTKYPSLCSIIESPKPLNLWPVGSSKDLSLCSTIDSPKLRLKLATCGQLALPRIYTCLLLR